MLQYKFFVRCFILAFLAFFISQNTFAQKGTLTIKGNIKLSAERDIDVDECCFHYQDILSGKSVVIPIRRDTAGNYEVTMEFDRYQQIYFSKAINIKGLFQYNVHMTFFSFFGKPGQSMRVDFVQKPYKLKFGGDFAKENQQYRDYDAAKDAVVKNLYDGTENAKFTPAQVKERMLKSFRDQLAFNNKYFKSHPTADFIKQQAYYDALYHTQSAAIQLNFISENKVTEAMVADFYKSMNATGQTYLDRPGLAGIITDPNPSLKNAGALGNERYKDFINSYYQVLRKNMPHAKEQTVLYKDIAAYILEKHPDVKETAKPVLQKAITGAKLDEAESRIMEGIMRVHANEFLSIRDNKDELTKFLAIKDPALRDLGATMNLYKKLEINQLDNVEPLLETYKKNVKNPYLKSTFLNTYNTMLDRLLNSKLPPLAVINATDDLKAGPDMLSKLLEKHKGKVIYLDVWATWCIPCIEGMGPSRELREKLKGKDVVFIYACISSTSTITWKNLIAERKMEGENYFFDPGQSAALGRALNVSRIPHYVLIDKAGNIVEKKATSPLDPKTFKQINDLLGEGF